MDERLRNLERSAQQGGFDEEVRLLLERLRQGTLSREALALAAYLDHPPARAVLGEEAPEPGDANPLQLTLGLHRWEQHASVLAIVAAARHVLAHHHAPDEESVPPEAFAAVEAAAAWLADPSEGRRALAAQRALDADRKGTRLARAAHYAARAAAARASDWADAPQWRDKPPERVVAHLASTLAGHGMFLCTGLVAATASEWMARRAERAATIHALIRGALVPWALR